MKIRSFLLLALSIGLIDTLLYSCCANEEPMVVGTFQFCSVTTSHFDNSGASPVMVSDTVNSEAYALEITVDMTDAEVCLNSSPFLLNGAFACSGERLDPVFSVREPIVDVRIITDNDFTSAYPAGTDVSSQFYVFTSNEYRALSRQFQIVQVEEIAPRRVLGLLVGIDPFEGMHSFTVEIELSDGSVISNATEAIYLR